MEPLSIIDIFKNLYNIVSSSTFFLVCLLISIFILLLTLIGIKKLKKTIKYFFVLSWLICLVLLIIKYFDYLLSILDNFVENVLISIYFPNISVFVIVLIISNILLFVSLFKNMKTNLYKVVWLISGILINFLFVLILEIVVKNNIDVYSATSVYTNSDLYVLLNASMIIITINVIFSFIIFISKKLISFSKNKKDTSSDIIYEQSVPNNDYSNNTDNTSNTYTSKQPLFNPLSNVVLNTNYSMPSGTNKFVINTNSDMIGNDDLGIRNNQSFIPDVSNENVFINEPLISNNSYSNYNANTNINTNTTITNNNAYANVNYNNNLNSNNSLLNENFNSSYNSNTNINNHINSNTNTINNINSIVSENNEEIEVLDIY